MRADDIRTVSKGIWKSRVKKYIHDKQRKELLEDIKRYKKLNHEELSKDRFEQKTFLKTLSLENSRMRYKVLSNVIPTVRSHFSRKYKSRSLTCPGCTPLTTTSTPVSSDTQEPKDTADHIALVCEAYTDLKDDDFDPDDDKMLSEFFRKVVQRRIEEGDD